MNMFEKIFGTLTKEEAVEIAAAECAARGWPWSEPIVAHRRLWTISIMTNADHRGGNASFLINTRTKKVEKSAFAIR